MYTILISIKIDSKTGIHTVRALSRRDNVSTLLMERSGDAWRLANHIQKACDRARADTGCPDQQALI